MVYSGLALFGYAGGQIDILRDDALLDVVDRQIMGVETVFVEIDHDGSVLAAGNDGGGNAVRGFRAWA